MLTLTALLGGTYERVLFAPLTAPKGHHMIAWGNAPGFGRASSHPFPLVPAPSLPAQRAGREGAGPSGVFGPAHGPGARPQAFLFGPFGAPSRPDPGSLN